MTIRIDRNIYSDECISKSVYSLADRYVIRRTIVDDNEEELFVIPKGEMDESVIETEVINSLNDYKLRSLIEKETHDIRIVLYAKAFAECDDVAEDDLD